MSQGPGFRCEREDNFFGWHLRPRAAQECRRQEGTPHQQATGVSELRVNEYLLSHHLDGRHVIEKEDCRWLLLILPQLVVILSHLYVQVRAHQSVFTV